MESASNALRLKFVSDNTDADKVSTGIDGRNSCGKGKRDCIGGERGGGREVEMQKEVTVGVEEEEEEDRAKKRKEQH